ncbi:nitroreductase family protein [Streptomyces flaveolus]
MSCVPSADDRAAVLRLLTTTRSVRRRLDTTRPVDIAIVRAALEVALQAPNGSNDQPWHWIVVTDPDIRRALADVYRAASQPYVASMRRRVEQGEVPAGVYRASTHLLEILADVPVLVVPCMTTGPEAYRAQFEELGYPQPVDHPAHSVYYGSIWPAIWSILLALRAHGLAGAVTALHLTRAEEAARVLRLPEGVTQAALLAVAHPTGTTFQPASRHPLDDVLHLDTW